MGVVTALKNEPADLCIINTCSVTDMADHKCRQIIRRLVRENPHSLVVVTGCYAQLSSDEIAEIEGVSLVLGANEKSRLIEFLSDAWVNQELTEQQRIHVVPMKEIRDFAPSCSRGNRTRYFLKIQDGCDYFCTYCTIPFARGRSRNASIESLVEQTKQVVEEGGKEIVLTGVNIGDFGKTTGESFFDLVKALDDVEGISRYRISSIEPDLLSDELIRYCAQSRAFMPHFHIPLQSGSDEVLRLMHRKYDTALFAHKINLIKELMPDAFIGVDVMVGCRGETPECFAECKQFLENLDVTQLHVFPYSERPKTAALRIPYIVPESDRKHRTQELIKLSDEKTQAFYAKYIDTDAEVLFEKAPRGKAMHGFTRNYIRVELSPSLACEEYDNQLLRVRLKGFNFDKSALKAEII